MKKRVVVVGAIVLVAAAGGLWMFARSRSSSADEYRLAILTCGTIRQTVSATGTQSASVTARSNLAFQRTLMSYYTGALDFASVRIGQ